MLWANDTPGPRLRTRERARSINRPFVELLDPYDRPPAVRELTRLDDVGDEVAFDARLHPVAGGLPGHLVVAGRAATGCSTSSASRRRPSRSPPPATTRGPDRAPGARGARPPHRHRQPPRLRGRPRPPARAVPPRGAAALGRARRPRPLQALQRHLRPPGRRPVPRHRGAGAPAARVARRRAGRAVRRRRVPRAVAGHRRRHRGAQRRAPPRDRSRARPAHRRGAGADQRERRRHHRRAHRVDDGRVARARRRPGHVRGEGARAATTPSGSPTPSQPPDAEAVACRSRSLRLVDIPRRTFLTGAGAPRQAPRSSRWRPAPTTSRPTSDPDGEADRPVRSRRLGVGARPAPARDDLAHFAAFVFATHAAPGRRRDRRATGAASTRIPHGYLDEHEAELETAVLDGRRRATSASTPADVATDRQHHDGPRRCSTAASALPRRRRGAHHRARLLLDPRGAAARAPPATARRSDGSRSTTTRPPPPTTTSSGG